MPTCIDCDAWRPPHEGLSTCPACGGVLLPREALIAARAERLQIPVEEYEEQHRAERAAARDARHRADAERAAAEIAAAAAAQGITVEEYHEAMRQTHALAGHGQAYAFGCMLFSLPSTAVAVVIATVVAWVASGAPLQGAVGAVMGAILGVVLAVGIELVTSPSRLGRLDDMLYVVAMALPPVTAVVGAIVVVAIAG